MAHPLASALARAEERTETSLTDKERASGAYQKGTLDWKGLKIAIENPKGSMRTGTGKDGKRWFVEMPTAYGYFKRTEGKDGDEVDCYLGNDHASNKVFVVDQKNAETGAFDEHKVFLGFPDRRSVSATYEKAFSDGKAKDRLGPVTELSVEELTRWLKHGDTKRPMAQQKPDKALELAQRYRKGYAHGGRVGYAEGGAPSEWSPAAVYRGLVDSLGALYEGDLGSMNGRERRRIQNQAMAGRPLSYQQMQALADAEAANEERSNRLGTAAATVGAELTGIPSIIRGGSNIAKGIEEGSGTRIAGGALEGALGAVPAGAFLRPVRGALAPIAGTLPRAIATSMAATGLSSYTDEAKAADRNAATAIASDPEVLALQGAKEKALAAMAKVNEKHARSGPETQRQALKPFQDEIALINDKLTKAEERARLKYMDQATFREKYPGLPMAIMAGGFGLAGGLPFAKNLGERAADKWTRRPAIEAAATKADKAFKNGLTDAETAIAQQILQKRLNAWDAKHGAIGAGANWVGNVGKGALLGAEASQLPEQLDYLSNAPGHPAREAAVKQFQNPEYYKERIGPALLGAASAMTGHYLSKMAPQNTEFLAPAREIAARGAEPSMTDKILAYINGRTAAGPSERAIQQVQRYREAVGPALGSKDARILEERLGIPAATDVPLLPPTSAATKVEPSLQAPPDVPRLAQRVQAQREAMPLAPPSPARSPEEIANLESAASRASDIIKENRPLIIHKSAAGLHYPRGHEKAGQFVDHEFAYGTPAASRKKTTEAAKPDTKGKELTEGKRSAKMEGKQGAKASEEGVPQKETRFHPDMDDPINRGMKRGGFVSKAMELARKYATGGKVVPHGLMAGATGGRADALPVSVPSGAYVIPADCVSGIEGAGGNTKAGAEIWAKILPPPKSNYAAGGHIPIKISDGEIVVSPDQVAQLGGGDMEAGHRKLDAMVQRVRTRNIQTLSRLPGPAR